MIVRVIDIYTFGVTTKDSEFLRLSEEKFREIAMHDFESVDLPKAIKRIYEVAPHGKVGDVLRKAAVHAAAANANYLYEETKDFKLISESVPAFLSAFALTLSGAEYGFVAVPEMDFIMACCECGGDWYLDLATANSVDTGQMCPRGCLLENFWARHLDEDQCEESRVSRYTDERNELEENDGAVVLTVFYPARARYRCARNHVFGQDHADVIEDEELLCAYCDRDVRRVASRKE